MATDGAGSSASASASAGPSIVASLMVSSVPHRSSVSVVFPPVEHSDGYSLVVDGDATVDGSLVDVAPTWAVLHRPAP